MSGQEDEREVEGADDAEITAYDLDLNSEDISGVELGREEDYEKR